MKQGVQLVLERVQRHRAFPRLASANGQNLPATLSPPNVPTPLGSRLGQPRFVPVLAEPVFPSVARVQNPAFELEAQDEIKALIESDSNPFEPVFSDQALANDLIQANGQIFEQTLEPSEGFEITEIVEPKPSSDSLSSEIPGENVLPSNTNLPQVAQANQTPNERAIIQAQNPQDSGVQTRASQTNQTANQQPISGTAQPRETLLSTTSSQQDNSGIQTSQPAAFATLALNPNFDQDISFDRLNQNKDTESVAEEISVSTVNTFLETPNLTPTQSIQTENASDESQLEAVTQIESSVQPVRSPSRLESTLEALRQFNPQIQNNESIADSQSIAPNARAARTSEAETSGITPSKAGSKAQSRTTADPQKPTESNLAKVPSQPENQKLSEQKLFADAKSQIEANNQTPSTIQITPENPMVTRANPVLNESATQTDNPSVLEASGFEDQINQPDFNQPDLNQSDPHQNAIVPARTSSLQTMQLKTPSIASTQTQILKVNPSQPELQPKTSSSEIPINPSLNTDARENTQVPSAVLSSTTQAPLSEEARERAAYQRSVTMRAERAKRALAAKEELERDPTLELETEIPASRPSEPQESAGLDLKPPLEPQSSSIELENLNPQAQNLETSVSNQTVLPDLDVAVESGSSHQFANNVAIVKPIVTPSTIEPLIENYPQNSRELQPTNSSEVQTLNSDQATINSNEARALDFSETQASVLKQSVVEDLAEIQSKQSPSQIQNSNLAQIPNPNQVADSIQTTTQNSSQAVTTPNQDVPASFLSNTQGVSVYNPQRRIQRAIPAPPKPKPEPNEAEKLFAEMPGMSQQDVLNIIRKAQGLAPLPTTSQGQNPVQENIRTLQNSQTTSNLSQETPQPSEQNIEPNISLSTAPLNQTKQDARVEQSQEFDAANSSVSVERSFEGTESKTQINNSAQNNPAQTSTPPVQAQSVIVDSYGSKIHVFNPPNRRVLPPKPKVEVQKTEAQKLFETMEVTETAEELFQRVVKNRLKPNTNLEPQERVQGSSLDSETTPEASTPSSSQTLLPNLPNRNLPNPSDQPANASFTGNERVQLSGSERVQLSQNATRFLKPIVGIDPNEVKIYRDPQTQRLTKAARADALTLGDTVLLSSEQPLESPETLGLIAHELTHVARNRQARFVPPVARGNSNLAASAQSGNEEGLALGVEAFARQGWNNFNQNTPNQNPGSQTTSSNLQTNRSSYGSLPAPADLPQWFIEGRTPPQAASQPTPRTAQVAQNTSSEGSFVPQAPTNQLAASMGAQAASQGRDVPTPPSAAGPLPTSQQPKPEPISNRAAPDLDAMARQVYTILKRRLANERHRM